MVDATGYRALARDPTVTGRRTALVPASTATLLSLATGAGAVKKGGKVTGGDGRRDSADGDAQTEVSIGEAGRRARAAERAARGELRRDVTATLRVVTATLVVE